VLSAHGCLHVQHVLNSVLASHFFLSRAHSNSLSLLPLCPCKVLRSGDQVTWCLQHGGGGGSGESASAVAAAAAAGDQRATSFLAAAAAAGVRSEEAARTGVGGEFVR